MFHVHYHYHQELLSWVQMVLVKSTLIKLLTAELVPQEGKVETSNLRIGYIAQHALQHVEQHKEKTANQYLQWRYRFGDDREVLLKESRKVSDEEQEMMKKEIDIGDGRVNVPLKH